MKIEITVKKKGVKFGDVRVEKWFTFEQEPIEMARYKTFQTVKRRIEDYVVRNGYFRADELKNLEYDMDDFKETWKDEVIRIMEVEKKEEEEFEEKLKELRKSKNELSKPNGLLSREKCSATTPNHVCEKGDRQQCRFQYPAGKTSA